jgi:hypothetical protein
MCNKNIQQIKHGLYILSWLVAGALFASCDKAIVVGEADEFPYLAANESYGYLKHAGTANNVISIDLRQNETRNIYVGLTKAGNKDISVSLEIDNTLIDAYNKANYTQHQPLPANLATIANNGNVTVTKWKTESAPVTVSLTKDEVLEGNTYLLPIKVKVGSEVDISSGADVVYYVVNMLPPRLSTAKEGWDGVTICYVEVNSNNPLNVGTYKLKNSGKPFFDICNIFAANVNYNPETGKTYLFFNPNVQHLLTNREKYIKPLQDMGIKVLLSILPNQQGIGLLNMTNDIAKDFALQMKAAVDAYGLDGVDFDEEWANYGTNGLPGANIYSYGRLLYETRKLMPDKLITVYYIGISSSAGLGNPVDGVNPGDLVDYSYYPYYGSWSALPSVSYFRGLTNAKWGPYPYAFHGTNGSTSYPSISTSYINNIKNGGYGVILLYDIRGYSETHKDQPNAGIMDYSDRLTIYSNILYGEEVVAGQIYQKDW